jgi:hypothetical protein
MSASTTLQSNQQPNGAGISKTRKVRGKGKWTAARKIPASTTQQPAAATTRTLPVSTRRAMPAGGSFILLEQAYEKFETGFAQHILSSGVTPTPELCNSWVASFKGKCDRMLQAYAAKGV